MRSAQSVLLWIAVFWRVNRVLQNSGIELHGIHAGCFGDLVEFCGIIENGVTISPCQNSLNTPFFLAYKLFITLDNSREVLSEGNIVQGTRVFKSSLKGLTVAIFVARAAWFGCERSFSASVVNSWLEVG